MTFPLVFRPEVRDEIDLAYAWYQRQRQGLGEEFLDALRGVLSQIEQEPELLGIVHRQVRAALLRRFPYVVYYRLEVNRIVIVAIQHGKRHPRNWRSRG